MQDFGQLTYNRFTAPETMFSAGVVGNDGSSKGNTIIPNRDALACLGVDGNSGSHLASLEGIDGSRGKA